MIEFTIQWEMIHNSLSLGNNQHLFTLVMEKRDSIKLLLESDKEGGHQNVNSKLPKVQFTHLNFSIRNNESKGKVNQTYLSLFTEGFQH